ncbi:MAG: FHA domain-containing protein, partial [Planctomycetota bacterium]
MAKIVITDGPGTGEEYGIDRAAILGRLPSNDIPLRDKKSSREHAKIYRQGKDFAIVDLNSSNGTFVNGRKVTKRILRDGDEISIGAVSMRYEIEAPEAPAQAQRRSLDEAFEAARGGAREP